ncbi:hypothetical protein AMV094 [Betaentomopoxvirus amoorei]|uniref:AMV094 n=1 Tax=Amsacta moorei entomopoxvirus TaxID=28321 RepID=Q9EMV5_AMEPV|nr:hypothetical protein AMV094 [Amsacta moorei entomopoxvirus]AAG02800.1 AMV094 [Amsacta moorei entomopoxvirus]
MANKNVEIIDFDLIENEIDMKPIHIIIKKIRDDNGDNKHKHKYVLIPNINNKSIPIINKN